MDLESKSLAPFLDRLVAQTKAASYKELRSVDFWNRRISTVAFLHHFDLSSIEILSLTNNAITDAGLAPLANAPCRDRITELYLRKNVLSDLGKLVVVLAQLKGLRHLWTSENPVCNGNPLYRPVLVLALTDAILSVKSIGGIESEISRSSFTCGHLEKLDQVAITDEEKRAAASNSEAVAFLGKLGFFTGYSYVGPAVSSRKNSGAEGAGKVSSNAPQHEQIRVTGSREERKSTRGTGSAESSASASTGPEGQGKDEAANSRKPRSRTAESDTARRTNVETTNSAAAVPVPVPVSVVGAAAGPSRPPPTAPMMQLASVATGGADFGAVESGRSSIASGRSAGYAGGGAVAAAAAVPGSGVSIRPTFAAILTLIPTLDDSERRLLRDYLKRRH